MMLANLDEIRETQNTLCSAFYEEKNKLELSILTALKAQLLLVLPNVASLTWDNTQEYDDNGYYSDIRNVAIHLTGEPVPLPVYLGNHNDVCNLEWDYISALCEFDGEIPALQQEEIQLQIAHFAKLCHCPSLQTEQQINFLLQTIGRIIEIAVSQNVDAVSYEIQCEEQPEPA